MSHPYAELASAERTEHHAVVLRYLNAEERALKLVRVVVEHACTFGVLRIDEVEFNHQLATVADAERQSVLACIELVERLFGLRIEEECSCPSLGRAENVGVGESSAEHNHVDVLECLASADEVGHHHILHVEAGQIERVSHFALAVGSLLTYDGSLDACALAAVGRYAVALKSALEAVVELDFQRLLLIVVASLLCATVEALLAVEQVRSVIPHVAQRVDVECMFEVALLYDDGAGLWRRITYLGISYSLLVHELGELFLVLVGYLNDNARVL